MPHSVHIVIDAMGGDFGPRPCVIASLKFVQAHPNCKISIVGDESLMRSFLPRGVSRVELIHAPMCVDSSEKPSAALRHKQSSSMSVAVAMVANGEAQACVSAGNTGALMAFGVRHLKMLPGIDRPAICKALPSDGQCCWVLDLGANIECTPIQLFQFAQMAATVARLHGVSTPRIGVLNVGSESQKGRELQQESAQLIGQHFGSQYIGFVEAGDIYRGVVDVVVCDGFTGNALLKASEGAVALLQKSLRQHFSGSGLRRILGLLVKPMLSSWRNDFEPARYNGAMFLGLAGILVKSHGSASEDGFATAILVAYEQIVHETIRSIKMGLDVNAQ